MKKRYWILSFIILFIFSGFLVLKIQDLNRERKESLNLINALGDTIKIWKDKDGLNRSKISVLESYRTQDFLTLQTKDKQILELQKRVKEYKDKLKEGSSVTIVKGETVYDTIYETKDSIREILGEISIIDTVDNKWITSVFGFNKDSTIYSLKVRNNYTVVIGEEKQGFLKPRKPFAEVINENPYSVTDTLRTYRVSTNTSSFDMKSATIGGISVLAIIGILTLILK